MIAVLVLSVAAVATVLGTHELCDEIAMRLRLARHRRLTRKHGEMLKRVLGGAR